jgi:SAM-dependent methyltransferase
MHEEMELNRGHWDEATRLHTRGDTYGLETFKAGGCRLHQVELGEVGDVHGKRLLHLQCYFGLDTLSWARRGAIVTGVDFSGEAIAAARRLAADTGLEAEFVWSDLYALPEVFQAFGSFDVVYTSYGVLCWLPDLAPWGALIARYLRPGGFFYIVEAHPTARMFPLDEDLPASGGFRPWLPYFHDRAGTGWPAGADYADPNALHTLGTRQWQHSMADIVNALTGAGLVIEWLREFPFCAWKVVAGCELLEDSDVGARYYGRPATEVQLPLMFSLRARTR